MGFVQGKRSEIHQGLAVESAVLQRLPISDGHAKTRSIVDKRQGIDPADGKNIEFDLLAVKFIRKENKLSLKIKKLTFITASTA